MRFPPILPVSVLLLGLVAGRCEAGGRPAPHAPKPAHMSAPHPPSPPRQITRHEVHPPSAPHPPAHHATNHATAPRPAPHHEANHPAPHPPGHHEADHGGGGTPHHETAHHVAASSHRGHPASHGYRGGYYQHSYGRRSYGYHRRSTANRGRRYPVRPNPETLLARNRLRKLKKLQGDLEGVKPELTVTQGQKTRLAGDLMDVAEGPARVDRGTVQLLADNLANSLGRRSKAEFDSASMALYLRELMNSSGTPRSQFRPAVARGQTLLRSAGITKLDSEDLGNSLRDVLAAFNPTVNQVRLK